MKQGFSFLYWFCFDFKKVVICAHCETCCLGRMDENSWNMSEKIWKIYELFEKFLRGYVFVCSGKTGLNPDPPDPTQRVLKLYKSSIWGNPIQKAKFHRIFFVLIFFKNLNNWAYWVENSPHFCHCVEMMHTCVLREKSLKLHKSSSCKAIFLQWM